MFDSPLTEEQKKLVEENLRLAMYLAVKYTKKCGLPVDELYQEGVIGLMAAAKKWNPALSKYSSYAYRWATRMMLEYTLQQKMGGLRPIVNSRHQLPGKPMLLSNSDHDIEDEEKYEIVDRKMHEPSDYAANRELIRRIRWRIQKMPIKQRTIVRMVLAGKSVSEIKKAAGCTRQAINQNLSRFAVMIAEKLKIQWMSHKYGKCIQCRLVRCFDATGSKRCPKCSKR